MDPNVCLLNIFIDIRAGDLDNAKDGLDNLIAWFANGGFSPDVRAVIAELQSQNWRDHISKRA